MARFKLTYALSLILSVGLANTANAQGIKILMNGGSERWYNSKDVKQVEFISDDNIGVYFNSDQQVLKIELESDSTFKIPVYREGITESASYPLTVLSSSDAFIVPNEVKFYKDATQSEITVIARPSKLVFGQPNTITFLLNYVPQNTSGSTWIDVEATITGTFGECDWAVDMAGNFDAFGQLGYSDRQNDFGYPALFLWTDMRGMDMYSIDDGYNWFLSPEEYSDGTPESLGPMLPWTYCYNTIRSANYALKSLSTTLNGNSISNKALYSAAQAHAYRAYAYFTLAQLFQFTYVGHEDDLCVPLLTEKNLVEAATEGCPRSTVQETYDLIISDLTTAIDYLSRTSTTASAFVDSKPNRLISLATAYGLRARAYLVMNQWANAANDAQAAINNFSGAPKSIAEAGKPSFNSCNENDWMWGIAVNETDRTVTTGICNFPSMMGSFSYGYATAVGTFKWINKTIFANIPRSDVRRGWWLDENGQSSNLTAAQQSYVTSVGATPGVQVKFAPYQNVIDTDLNASDIPLMRVEEMYLVLAEAQGMQSAAQGAETLTNFVRTYRDPGYTCNATTPEALQDAVWFQRRVELWGEGFSYYDMLRLKKDMNRVGGGWPKSCVYNIKANDPVLIFPIPQSEIDANKALTDADNTNGGPQPTPVEG